MGWIHCYNAKYYKPDGSVDRRKCCDDMLNWESKDEKGNVVRRFHVIKSAMVGSVYYAAVAREKNGVQTDVTAAIFLTCGKTRHDNTIWGYKDMDETCGPCECKCPVSILNLLTPIESEWANNWRENCRKYAAEQADKRKNGDKVLYAPKGVSITVKGLSWVITSAEYCNSHVYTGVKFTKRRWGDPDRAMKYFLESYGTAAQKKEFAESGRECPVEWMTKAA